MILAAASGLALIALAPAQMQLVRNLDSKLAAQPEGSVAWFGTSLDRVAALSDVDVRKALVVATKLYEQALVGGPNGYAQAFAAHAAYLTTNCEGPNAAESWVARATAPSDEADDRCRADFYLTRARTICHLGKHADELPLTIRGRTFAESAGDWARQVQAALMTIHLSPTPGLFSVNRLMSRASEAGAGGRVAFLRTSVWLKRVEHLISRGDAETAASELTRTEMRAEAQGNQRVLCHVAATRAEMAVHDGNLEEGLRLWADARAKYDTYGNVENVIFAVDASAEICITLGRVDDARMFLNEQAALLEGRGWRVNEDNMLITRFNLAVKEHNGALADELSGRIDEMVIDVTTEEERSVDASERLARAELERADAERQLQEAQLRFAQDSHSVWMWSSIAGGLGLGLLLGVSWFARRRLLHANRLLADKIEQVEEGLSAQQRLEERMRQMERAEGLGTLAAGIAHDFNNLLTSMIGGAELLRAQDDRGDHKELTNMILAAGQQGSRLCRQLQSYSGGMPLVREPHDLCEVIKAMLPTLTASVKHAVEIKLADDCVPTVARVDRGQFEQILLNLVINSHEAGAKTVTIKIRQTEAEGGDNRMAVLDIRDNGGGMSPEVAHRIFDPFFTTKFPGRGLGLAVVFGGVCRHGGRVTVDSPSGGGSCFTIQLPLGDEAAVLPRPPAEPGDESATTNVRVNVPVILIDDEPIVRLALKSMLARLGVTAEAFATGQDAVAFVERLPAKQGCIAIVDLTMPGMEGAEVIRLLRATDRPVQCVLMSGHADDYVKECARKLGTECLLPKPFSLDEVRQVLLDLTENMQGVG